MGRYFGRVCLASVLFVLASFVSCGGSVLEGDPSAGAQSGSGGASGSVSSGGSGGERCGNGVIDAYESCDRSNLNGENCMTATAGARPVGTLRCSSSCTFDITDCLGSGGVGGSAGMGSGGIAGSAGFAGGVGGAGGLVIDYDLCYPGDACVLLPANCCGYCSAQPLSMFVAVNQARVAGYSQQYCSGGFTCPPCANYPEPDYTAVCRGGRCVPVDVRTDALAACSTSADCRLRWGAECCERCGSDPFGEGLTAVRASDFEQAVCGSAWACPDCGLPAYPADVTAECSSGYCTVSP